MKKKAKFDKASLDMANSQIRLPFLSLKNYKIQTFDEKSTGTYKFLTSFQDLTVTLTELQKLIDNFYLNSEIRLISLMIFCV